jgi:hypothetical protein
LLEQVCPLVSTHVPELLHTLGATHALAGKLSV